ncbi:hypothetical protein PG999_004045 [Apiospora kogelbergensis]|uniref:Uncharacterized protein n=1 Tax=Apiospora kogelbergensis TaxID=1337665 RepID=A0AAW0R5H0_9PEZI
MQVLGRIGLRFSTSHGLVLSVFGMNANRPPGAVKERIYVQGVLASLASPAMLDVTKHDETGDGRVGTR